MTLVRGASQPVKPPAVFTPVFISRGEQGIQGERGLQGLQGEQGLQGLTGNNGADATPHIVFVLTAVSSWNQVHSFPYPPSVRLINDLNQECDIYVEHLDSTHVNISFPTPFTGKIVLS